MPKNDTLILRVELEQDSSIYRDIEIDGSKTLYKLAEGIVGAFGFYFDHAFGFYAGHDVEDMWDARPRYELFADIGEDPDPGVLGVKKTKVAEAFPAVGHKMLFLFDYGDDWLFRVTFREAGTKVAKTKYPRVVASQGDAPEQYPEADEIDDDHDDDDDRPIVGVNLKTGEKIVIGE